MRSHPGILLVVLMHVGPIARADTDAVVIEQWSHRMAQTATLFEAKNYQPALRLANKSVSEMVEMLGAGDAAFKWFAITLTHKALAHAGLGEREEALWYWHSVLSLYPRIREADLSSFGEPGAFLKANLSPAGPAPMPQLN